MVSKSESSPILTLDALTLAVKKSNEEIPLVHALTFNAKRYRITGLIGESGSGKTLTSRAVMGILPDQVYIHSGSIILDGVDVTHFNKQNTLKRGRDVGYMFQNPSSMFTPVLTIGRQLMESAIVHLHLKRPSAKEVVFDYLERVGLGDKVNQVFRSYPHMLSGGMLQRAMLAMVLIPRPRLLIADEPTAALDVMTQFTILELLARLKRDLNLTILFISHDLSVISNLCDDVYVMRSGRILEHGDTETVFSHPVHPYTRQLLDASLI